MVFLIVDSYDMGIYGMFFFGPLRDSGLDSAGKKVQKRKMLEDLE